MDYVHASRTGETGEDRVEKATETAQEVSNRPGLLLRIDDLYLTGEVGFVNEDQTPSYRIFLQQAELQLTNLSNQFRQGSSRVRLTGKFMGSGQTEIEGRFRPEQDGPDFDLYVRLVETQLKSMNDVLRAYGDFDVSQGLFSLFTEVHVQNDRIDGYVKPFFQNLYVHDPSQDEEDSLFQKLYEGLIDSIANLLKNEATERVATKADISGKVENPEASTWQIIVNLIQNAFFDIILPGFEQQVRS